MFPRRSQTITTVFSNWSDPLNVISLYNIKGGDGKTAFCVKLAYS